MSAHDRYLELLARRAELTAPEEIELRRHLHDCSDCSLAADDYARQTVLLRSLPVARPQQLVVLTNPDVLRGSVNNSISTALSSFFEAQNPRPTWMISSIRGSLIAATPFLAQLSAHVDIVASLSYA